MAFDVGDLVFRQHRDACVVALGEIFKILVPDALLRYSMLFLFPPLGVLVLAVVVLAVPCDFFSGKEQLVSSWFSRTAGSVYTITLRSRKTKENTSNLYRLILVSLYSEESQASIGIGILSMVLFALAKSNLSERSYRRGTNNIYALARKKDTQLLLEETIKHDHPRPGIY
jgi:hypothetical protein